VSAPTADALHGTMMGSANYQFKSKYWRTMEIALLISAALHALAFLTVPPHERGAYTLDEKEMEVIDVPDDIVIPPPPEEIDRPVIPSEMEISDDVSAEETIPETDFNPFAPPAIASDGSGEGSDAFYAFDTPPTPIKKVAPEYPELARSAGAEGKVLVEIIVDRNGRVIDARVVSSDTIPALADAAKKAAMGWLFTPAKQRDLPVKARIVIPFEFKIRSS